MKKYEKHLLIPLFSCFLAGCTFTTDESLDSVGNPSLDNSIVEISNAPSEDSIVASVDSTGTTSVAEVSTSSGGGRISYNTATSSVPSVSTIPSVSSPSSNSVTSVISSNTSTSSDSGSYYAGISQSATGATLRKQLYDLMMSTHANYTSYSGLANAFKTTDVNPNNSGQVMLFYTGEFRAFTGSFTGSINREHVWPNSKGVGKSGPGSDSHHLRPCDVNVNSSRGNLGYGPGGYIPSDAFKGIAARIIFYVGMHYGPDSSYKLAIVESVSGSDSSFGSLSTLLDWNKRFPVQDSEVRRNVAAQAIQGNRNPFIDNPDYACKIWGNDNSSAKSACGY